MKFACLYMHGFSSQHAAADVEKMVLGNKCDMDDKRQVSKDRGEQVRCGFNLFRMNLYIGTFQN